MTIPKEKSNPRRVSWNIPALVIALVIFAGTMALYFPTRSYSWANLDDNDYVTENAHVVTGLTRDNVTWAFTHFHMGYWIPVTWISHMIDCQIWGSDPGPPHLVNATFHALNAILLFWLLMSITARPSQAGAIWRSALVAALFAWHPLHVESVAWLAERKDMLSTFFWLLATLAYIRYTRNQKIAPYLVTLLLFVASLMAKPTLVTFPITLLLLDLWPLRRIDTHSWKKLITEKIPFLIISAIFSGLTILSQSRIGALSDIKQIPLSLRAGNALVSYTAYLWKTVWPTDLIAFYPFPPFVPAWKALLAFGFLFAITILVLRQFRARPYLVFGWFWFLVTLLPMIGLFQAGAQAMGDRFSYVPLIGIFVAIAWGSWDLVRNFRWGRALATATFAAALVVCFALSLVQMKQWKDPVTLFTRVLAVAGPVPIAHDHLGAAFFRDDKLDAAIEHFQSVLALDPDYPDAHNNLGAALFKAGRHEEAFAELEEALRQDPMSARANTNYGNALLESGRYSEAIDYYKKAVEIRPDYWMAHSNLGAALSKLGRNDEAIEQFREALKWNPDFEPAQRNLKDLEP